MLEPGVRLEPWVHWHEEPSGRERADVAGKERRLVTVAVRDRVLASELQRLNSALLKWPRLLGRIGDGRSVISRLRARARERARAS